MSEISDQEVRTLARELRIAALISLGRADEATGLPPLAPNPIRSTPAPPAIKLPSTRKGVRAQGVPPEGKDLFPQVIKRRRGPGTGFSMIASSHVSGTLHWVDRKKSIGYVVPDGGGPMIPVKVPKPKVLLFKVRNDHDPSHKANQ